MVNFKTFKTGIEIEFSGITREHAAETVSKVIDGTITKLADHYDTRKITAPDGRVWKIVYDSSIKAQKKERGRLVGAEDTYKCELVSPILNYENDIETVQNIVRALRKAGAVTSPNEGIHIHLNGADHNVKTLINFINLFASRGDLFYKALQVAPDRMRFCKKVDEKLTAEIKARKPKTLQKLEDIWYKVADANYNRTGHYNPSRYCMVNLHSFFHGCGTVEIRFLNSCLHAGKVRAYWLFILALNNQALTSKFISTKKPQTENEKFSMRVFLNRLGFIGDEFKNPREHLTSALSGNSAWRYGEPTAPRAREA